MFLFLKKEPCENMKINQKKTPPKNKISKWNGLEIAL